MARGTSRTNPTFYPDYFLDLLVYVLLQGKLRRRPFSGTSKLSESDRYKRITAAGKTLGRKLFCAFQGSVNKCSSGGTVSNKLAITTWYSVFNKQGCCFGSVKQEKRQQHLVQFLSLTSTFHKPMSLHKQCRVGTIGQMHLKSQFIFGRFCHCLGSHFSMDPLMS